MSSGSLVLELAEFAVAQDRDRLPDEVAASVRRRILDTVGLVARAATLDTSRAAIDWVRSVGGAPQATATGLVTRVPAPQAAFVNGSLAHSLDFDDTHLPSVLHPSASVIPAALAAGQLVEADGREVTAAIAVGLEICVRLGMAGYDEASGNSLFFEHGQHATSICGTLASAAAAARLHGLDAAGIASAVGVAASMAGGILEANRTGGTVKRIHCGWAAKAGVSAAALATRGFTGPPTVLEGRFGFFEAFLHGKFHPEALTDGLGDDWAVPDIFFKPYPANHFTHAAIDAATRLRDAGLHADDIETLHLEVPTATVRTIGEPLSAKQKPETGYQAQFSGPYTVAAALLGGGGLGLSLEDFTDELASEERRRALMAKVTVSSNPRLDRIFPHQFPAILRAETADGSVYVEEVLVNRGGPEDPLSDEELSTKFRDNASTVMSEPVVDRLIDQTFDFDAVDDLDAFLAPLTSIRGAEE